MSTWIQKSTHFFSSAILVACLCACQQVKNTTSAPIAGIITTNPDPSDLPAKQRNCEAGESGPSIIGGRKISAFGSIGSKVVMVRSLDSKGRPGICTGSLVARDVVLTAAHCFRDDQAKADVAFTTDLNCDQVHKTLAQSEVLKIYKHAQFSKSHSSNDVALLHLAQPAPNWMSIMPIDFATQIPSSDGPLFAAGYGYTVDDPDGVGSKDPMLRLTSISQRNEVSSEEASAIRRSLNDIDLNLDSHFWFIDNSLGHGICAGDSGGPLLSRSRGYVTQVGIANFIFNWSADGGACSGSAIYLKLSDQKEWLQKTFSEIPTSSPNPFN